jgi:hypothetical protein
LIGVLFESTALADELGLERPVVRMNGRIPDDNNAVTSLT